MKQAGRPRRKLSLHPLLPPLPMAAQHPGVLGEVGHGEAVDQQVQAAVEAQKLQAKGVQDIKPHDTHLPDHPRSQQQVVGHQAEGKDEQKPQHHGPGPRWCTRLTCTSRKTVSVGGEQPGSGMGRASGRPGSGLQQHMLMSLGESHGHVGGQVKDHPRW